MPKKRRILVAAGIAGSFAALVGAIIFMMTSKIVTFEMGKLMLAALLGMYVGFGFLIAVYLLIRKLE